MTKWAEVSAGAMNAAVQRLVVGMGEDASAIINQINYDEAYLKKIIALAQKELKLLKPMGFNFLIRGTKKFVAAKKFIIDADDPSLVRISSVGENFTSLFLSKVERNLPDVRLRWWKLQKSSPDERIITELDTRCEISLHAFYETLILRQVNSNLSCFFVAYVRDTNGELRRVAALWGVSGWRVDAYALDSWGPWGVDVEFVSL